MYRVVKKYHRNDGSAAIYATYTIQEFKQPWSLIPFLNRPPQWMNVKRYEYDSAGGSMASAIFYDEVGAVCFLENLKKDVPPNEILV